jgi:hypothetical protein
MDGQPSITDDVEDSPLALAVYVKRRDGTDLTCGSEDSASTYVLRCLVVHVLYFRERTETEHMEHQ